MLIALGVEIELLFTLRSTVAEITAIEVSAVAAILDFSEHLKMTIRAIAYCPQGRNRAPFRSTIAEITAIEVSAVAAILDFSKHLKMAFWAIPHCPLGRNRAPFRSTIDGC